MSWQRPRQYLAAFPASEPQVRKKYILRGPLNFALLRRESMAAGSLQPCTGETTTQGFSEKYCAGPPCLSVSLRETISSPQADDMIFAA